MNRLFNLVLTITLFATVITSCKKDESGLPTITTSEIEEITEDSAWARGEIIDDGGAKIIEYGVVYAITTNPTVANATKATVTPIDYPIDRFGVNLTGLEPETEYFVRAYAINSAGVAYGNEVSFTTLAIENPEPEPELPQIITAEVIDITVDSATVGGEIIDDGGAEIIEYGVVNGTMQNTDTDIFKEVVTGDGTGSFTVNLIDLTPETEYFVRAYAINSAGIAYGYIVYFSTLAEEEQEEIHWNFAFDDDDEGFEAIFADYHDDGHNFEHYAMDFGHREIPVEGAESMGLYITSINLSDDMFMGFVKKLEGLQENQNYTFTVSFQLATFVEPEMVGIGGSPGESVAVKGGITVVKPESMLNSKDGHYRMNIDTGSQGNSGSDMQVLGNMSKPEHLAGTPGFVYKEFDFTFSITTDHHGCAYLIIASDSGFEGLTEYYLDNIMVTAIGQ